MAKTQIVLQPADVARLRRAQVALSDVLGAVATATTRAAAVQPRQRRKPRKLKSAVAKPEVIAAAGS